MLRHIAIAAFRNLAANKLIAAIAILGLAAGIAAALLMALVVRNQMSFEHFIAGHERTYRVFYRNSTSVECRGRAGGLWSLPITCLPLGSLAARLREHPAIEGAARLDRAATPARFQQGEVTAFESFFWADTEFFSVMPLPVLHGTLKDALARPNDMVLTAATARKYFGRDDVVGRTLRVAGYPMTVRAVLRDLPANATTLDNGIFISFLGAPAQRGAQKSGALTRLPAASNFASIYLRTKPGATFTQAQATEAYWDMPITRRTKQNLAAFRNQDPNFNYDTTLLRLDEVNLWEPLNPGIRLRLAVTIMAGALVLLTAAINFVNLMVAGAMRREKEIGLRKVCGGGRGALMLQFLGEAVITVGIAAVIGVALTEWLLPPVNAFLRAGASLDWHDPLLLLGLPAGIAVLALAISAWPAFMLSGFRPSWMLRGWAARTAYIGTVRGALAMVQFSILIVLAIVALVVWLQRDFAAREALRADSDQMLLVRVGASDGTRVTAQQLTREQACPTAFVEQVRRLAAVRGAVCSSGAILSGHKLYWLNPAKQEDSMAFYPADARLFALYGVKPVAGTLPPVTGTAEASGAVINRSAVRKLGFASPQAAIGQDWVLAARTQADFRDMFSKYFGRATVITAVVPDFNFGPVNQAIPPALSTPWDTFANGEFNWDNSGLGLIHIKLNGRDIPEALAAIDRIWTASGIDQPLDRFFLDDYMQLLYQDMTRDAQFFAGCTVLALLLACLGLVGIAVSTSERRTKEIGVRKAMGATTPRIVGLLLWQFSLPVLLANIIAWPLAFWLMQRWLSGFAYRIELSWWLFATASGGALLLALLTVIGQAIKTARQKPVLALRYE
jgi:putative ABC transport system permease protein